MADVRLTDVVKSYGATDVVDRVSLDIKHGEFIALVGPSGSGKSTLLRMIAGLETISSGTIAIDGRVVNMVPPKHRDIAMVFQNYALYPHMTVRANLGFGLKMHGTPRREIDAAVNDAAAALNLQLLLDRYPRELSGGQRQRVATGRAIVRRPRVFLFDEPLSNLDAKLRVQVRAELRQLHQHLGITSIYVTHDQVEAMTMADRIVVLRDGRIEQTGAPLDLYDRPDNIFVATFIGSPAMNLLAGQYRRGAVVMPDGTAIRADGIAPQPDGTPLTIGIRPEHLEIAAGDEGFAARLIGLEPTGAETMVLADFCGTIVTATTPKRLSLHPGTVFRLKPCTEKQFYFDATGASVGCAGSA